MEWEEPSLYSMWERMEEGWLLLLLKTSKRAEHPHVCSRRQEGSFPLNLLSMTLILTAEMRPWDHCPSSTALAGMAPTCEEGGEK